MVKDMTYLLRTMAGGNAKLVRAKGPGNIIGELSQRDRANGLSKE